MRPWVNLGIADVPGDKTQLRLMQRGDEFSIMVGGNELMNSRLSGSEEALANLAAERLKERANPSVLIGGLGMGFTLRAALKSLPDRASIVVAELVPEVVAWARGPLQPVFGDCLDDPRVTIHTGDVGKLIASSKAQFDAILLDVDNGPDGVSREGNDCLYQRAGLAHAHAALKPAGLLCVWSAHPSAPFARRLGGSGFAVEEFATRARAGGKGARHVIWIGTKR